MTAFIMIFPARKISHYERVCMGGDIFYLLSHLTKCLSPTFPYFPHIPTQAFHPFSLTHPDRIKTVMLGGK